jgi:hypothetical protein
MFIQNLPCRNAFHKNFMLKISQKNESGNVYRNSKTLYQFFSKRKRCWEFIARRLFYSLDVSSKVVFVMDGVFIKILLDNSRIDMFALMSLRTEQSRIQNDWCLHEIFNKNSANFVNTVFFAWRSGINIPKAKVKRQTCRNLYVFQQESEAQRCSLQNL